MTLTDNQMIDLRSDTVTTPTPQMLEAIYTAKVGDDFYGDDPTVKELEELSAQMLGKEAGLFVASGTMGNLVSVMSQTNRGESILLEKEAHMFRCESGNISAIAGILPKCIEGSDGFFNADDVYNNMIVEGMLFSKTTLLCIENPHNAAGGTILDKESLNELCITAHRIGLKVHIDGARIFSAAVCSNVKPSDLVKEADTVTFCLSKDLGCPYGSVVVGTRNNIYVARKIRQMLGGGLRQGGLMAAAGVFALHNHIARLKDDHENALFLANGLLELGFKVNLHSVQTNMVYADVPSNFDNISFCDKLRENGILVNSPQKGKKIRFVLHIGITRGDVLRSLDIISKLVGKLGKK